MRVLGQRSRWAQAGTAMQVIYVCKAVDESSPTLATQVGWIRSLAARPEIANVRVLTARHRRAELPYNVDVSSFEAGAWPGRIVRFYLALLRARPWRADLFFVAQGGPYPALLLPVKVVTGALLVHWKAQPYMSPRMRFYARWCDDLIFTATPSSLPLTSAKLRVVGHGIDTELFKPRATSPSGDLVAIGRISPIKRLEWTVRAMARGRELLGSELTFDIVGPCEPADEAYRQNLRSLAAELGLAEKVRFHEPVEHDRVPDLLARYRAFVNFSRTAFDKAAGEAMSCGIPVVTTNPATIEMLPAALRPRLTADEEDLEAQAALLHRAVSWDDDTRATIGRQLRATIVADHSLDRFFGKILAEVEAHIKGRRVMAKRLQRPD